MPEYTLTAPQTITVGDTAYHIVAPSTVPPVTPPVTPPAGRPQANVAKAGSGDWIIRTDTIRLDITNDGMICYAGADIPGSANSAAVGYDPTTNSTYRQTNLSGPWYYWGGKMSGPDWATQPATWVPPGAAPPVTPPQTGTPKAKLISYLQSITGKNLLAGQVARADSREINHNRQVLGFDIAIQVFDPWLVQWAGNYVCDTSFMPAALDHVAKGGIVGIEFNLPNPAGGGGSQDGNQCDAEQILSLGSSQNRTLMGFLDQGIAITQQFKDKGVAILFRIGWEMDGGWFWWGDVDQKQFGKFNGTQYGRLWRMIRNYMEAKGQDHLLWQFAVNGGPGRYTYPGDDVVDIIGVDGYTNDPVGRYKPVYDRLLAQAPSKLFAFHEWGSGDPGSNNPNFNTQTLIDAIRNTMPKTVIANAWSGWDWGLETGAKAALSQPFVINRPVKF